MTTNKNDNEVFGITQKSIRQDILLFKEEVLKDVKVAQREFANKFTKMEDILKEQINIYESKINTFEHRIKNLSTLITSDRSLIQKIEELNQFKDETKDKLVTESIRLTNLETDYKGSLKNIENILSTSVIYPGIIGSSARFKTFHDYIDYVLKHISDLNQFKEKSIFDLTPYKKKLDESIDFIKFQINNIVSSANEFTVRTVNESEKRVKSLIQLYDDRLQDTRVENAHYSIGLEKKSEELSRLIKNVYEVKDDVYKKLNSEVNNMKVEQRTLLRHFTGYKKQFTVIKDKFNQLSEFIRDVRFRVNIAPDVKKREFINMAKQLEFKEKFSSSFNNKKKMDFVRRDTLDLSKRNSKNFGNIFDSPFKESPNRFISNNFSFKKRNSLEISGNLLSNNLIGKFEIDKDDSNPILRSQTKKNINVKSIFDNGPKSKVLTRRNTEKINFINKINKDFSDTQSNNNFSNLKKEEENSIYSSKSSDEEKNKKEDNDLGKIMKKSTFKILKSKVIKEEDENNNSEISDDNNKKTRRNKEDNKKNKVKSDLDTKGNNINKEEEKKENNNENIKENNKDKKKNIDNSGNKTENNKLKKNISDNNIKKDNIILEIGKNMSNEDFDKKNNFKINLNLKNKIITSKIINNQKENAIKSQENKFELQETFKKEKEKTNTVSIIDINDIFWKNIKLTKKNAFLNTANNFFNIVSQDNNYKKPKAVTSRAQLKNNSNPSIIKKKNKIIIDSNSFVDKEKIISRSNNRKYEEIGGNENTNLEWTGQAYKTYSVFPKVEIDSMEGKSLNTKVINLNSSKNKKNIEVANNFLNKKIAKASLNKGLNIYNNSNKIYIPAILDKKKEDKK